MRSETVSIPVLAQAGRLYSAEATADELSAQPFLFGAFPGDRPKAELSGLPSDPNPITRYIFHTAFCCSTLLARALDVPGQNLSLKEPDILMQLANAQRMNAAEGQVGFLRRVEAGLFDIGKALNETIVVKPTNAANRLAPDMLANPNSRAIVIHSDLRSFLLSIARKGEEGRVFCRRLFNIFRMDNVFAGAQSERDLLTLTDFQIAALVWAMQCEQLNAAAQRTPDRVRAIHCDDFLKAPESVLRQVSAFLGLSLNDALIEEICQSDVFRKDAKDDAQGYDAGVRQQDRAEALSQFEKPISITEDWAAKLPLPLTLTIQPL